MTKKIKKIYKKALTLAPKVTLNRKWTVWRASETKDRQAQATDVLKKLLFHSLWQDQRLTTLVAAKPLAEDFPSIHEAQTSAKPVPSKLPSVSLVEPTLDYLRARLQYRLWDMNKRSATARTKNYCHYVGRARSVNRDLFMARHTLRKFARFGMLPGFIKERC